MGGQLAEAGNFTACGGGLYPPLSPAQASHLCIEACFLLHCNVFQVQDNSFSIKLLTTRPLWLSWEGKNLYWREGRHLYCQTQVSQKCTFWVWGEFKGLRCVRFRLSVATRPRGGWLSPTFYQFSQSGNNINRRWLNMSAYASYDEQLSTLPALHPLPSLGSLPACQSWTWRACPGHEMSQTSDHPSGSLPSTGMERGEVSS